MVADDLFFPEGPRWRADENKLYFSDVMASKVSRVDEAGTIETVFEPGEFPSGLGFLANGDMLVVATDSREIVRLSADVVAAGGASRSDYSLDPFAIPFVFSKQQSSLNLVLSRLE